MSRGFVKEDDQEEVPFVPPRAYLPLRVTNYVTQQGFDALLAEKEALIREKESLENHNENERRISANLINTKLQLLDERIFSARVIKLDAQQKDVIRFGATFDLKNTSTNEVQRLQITGVDEADISKGKLSFISPLAKALINRKAGEQVVFKKEKNEVVFQIISISYE
jgi:transcription elongation factor GreB